MELATCKGCKRLFNYVAGPRICPACREKLEKKFLEVRDYIRENPNAGIAQVSEEMDVSVQQIKTWIRQERLSFSKDSDVAIECEKCGAKIYTGRFCNQCKKNMADTLDAMYPQQQYQKKEKEQDKMRHF